MDNKEILSKIAIHQESSNFDVLRCPNDTQHLPMVGSIIDDKVVLKCLSCGEIDRYIPTFVFKNDWKDWWQSLSATERFPLMRKYDVKQVSDKLIKKMWRGEFLNGL